MADIPSNYWSAKASYHVEMNFRNYHSQLLLTSRLNMYFRPLVCVKFVSQLGPTADYLSTESVVGSLLYLCI